jgi:hypothetical protein
VDPLLCLAQKDPAILTVPKTLAAVPASIPVPASTLTSKKKSSTQPRVILLNPLKVVPSSKLSSKPKEIIDLGTILLRSYKLPPLSPSSKPFSFKSSLSPPPIIRRMTPAQLLAKLRQEDIAASKAPSQTLTLTSLLLLYVPPHLC